MRYTMDYVLTLVLVCMSGSIILLLAALWLYVRHVYLDVLKAIMYFSSGNQRR